MSCQCGQGVMITNFNENVYSRGIGRIAELQSLAKKLAFLSIYLTNLVF